MTLSRFQYLLKKINPRLCIRQRGYGDVGGIFSGFTGHNGYIARITKGDIGLAGYRYQTLDRTAAKAGLIKYNQGKIQKRGRKTLIMILQNWRWIKTRKQKSMLLWGIEPNGGEKI